LFPTGASFDFGGGSGGFLVFANPATCSWTAVSNVDWLIIDSGASGTGNTGGGYSVSSNPNSTQRIGTLTIGGQPFTVTQAPYPLGFYPATPCRVVDTRVGQGKTSP